MFSKTMMTAAAATLVLAASLVSTLQAADAPAPRALAVVNITKVFSALNEKISGDADIDKMAKDINDQKRKKEDEIERMTNDLKSNAMFKEDSPEYKSAQDQLLQKTMDLQSYLSFSQQKLYMEQRLRTAQIYRSMNNAIKEYSESHGIGLVLATDEVDFSSANTTQEVTQRIALRKVIYANPDFDITQKIIEKMNADYKLGK